MWFQRSRGVEHSPGTQDEQVKKLLARQRTKDMAEQGKALLDKNKELEQLRLKCQELTDSLTSNSIQVGENMKRPLKY